MGVRDRNLVLGVDPGLTGALSLVYIKTPDICTIIDVPTYRTPTKQRKSGYFTHVDLYQLSHLLKPYRDLIKLAVVEAPTAMPKQGLSSTFRFGEVCGGIRGVLAGLDIPAYPISPSAWKFQMGLSSNKDESRRLATEFFPNYAEYWRLKKHNDRAEAAIMCMYGIKHLKSLLNI